MWFGWSCFSLGVGRRRWMVHHARRGARPSRTAAALSVLATCAALTSRANEDAFGGGASQAQNAEEDSVCVVQTDDGRWRPCADILRATVDHGASESEETQALRERMRELERTPKVELPEQKTDLELEVERARLDPTLPLLALRIQVARAAQRVKQLENQGRGGRSRENAEAQLAAETAILADVERIALRRMDVCSVRRGNKPMLRNFRMTPAGPVVLTQEELMAQAPLTDPEGCARIYIIDEDTVARVRRAHALRHILATKQFSYHKSHERRALEDELSAVESALSKDFVPTLSLPGARDPGAR